jgi:hypothetical protein
MAQQHGALPLLESETSSGRAAWGVGNQRPAEVVGEGRVRQAHLGLTPTECVSSSSPVSVRYFIEPRSHKGARVGKDLFGPCAQAAEMREVVEDGVGLFGE